MLLQGGTTNNPRPSEFGTGNDAKALLQADASTIPISRRFIDVETREPYVARTDFDTWAQAEAAIQAGVSVEELVRREFTRTYPAQDVAAVTIVKNLKPIANLVATYDKCAFSHINIHTLVIPGVYAICDYIPS